MKFSSVICVFPCEIKIFKMILNSLETSIRSHYDQSDVPIISFAVFESRIRCLPVLCDNLPLSRREIFANGISQIV